MGLQQGLQGAQLSHIVYMDLAHVWGLHMHLACTGLACLLPHLEVGLTQDAGQLGCCTVLLHQVPNVVQDLLHQLQVVIPHCLQFCLLQSFVGLGWGQGTPAATGAHICIHMVHTRTCMYTVHIHLCPHAPSARAQSPAFTCVNSPVWMHICTQPLACTLTHQPVHACASARMHIQIQLC